MADETKAVVENEAGDFFVDSSCIDCDACRQIAPNTFGQASGYSYVRAQPGRPEDRTDAVRALLACPVGSIGTRGQFDVQLASRACPCLIHENVFLNGFNSRKSYGANSYFIRQPAGNWMIDSPRWSMQLVREFEKLGGLRYIFLTHRDDVADAHLYAAHFGAQRIIHRRDISAMPDCEVVIDADDEHQLLADMMIIPSPGHTSGHMLLLYKNRYLFTGDHLDLGYAGRPDASRDYCWYSWSEQIISMERLLNYDFEWILPGHGQRGYLPIDRMKAEIRRLIDRMRT